MKSQHSKQQDFASLSLDERRRAVYEKMCLVMPYSPIVRDYLAGKIKIPVRGRKPKAKRNEKTSMDFLFS
jgi:hypothetical protein